MIRLKKCNTCDKLKRMNEEHYSRLTSSKDGWKNTCKDCNNEYKRQYLKKHPAQKTKLKLWKKANKNKLREYRRSARIKKVHGISTKEYDTKIKSAQGYCQVCERYTEGQLCLTKNKYDGSAIIACRRCVRRRMFKYA